MTPLRQQPCQVVVGGADAPVLDRAENVQGGDADPLRLPGRSGKIIAEIRIEGREEVRSTLSPKP